MSDLRLNIVAAQRKLKELNIALEREWEISPNSQSGQMLARQARAVNQHIDALFEAVAEEQQRHVV